MTMLLLTLMLNAQRAVAGAGSFDALPTALRDVRGRKVGPASA